MAGAIAQTAETTAQGLTTSQQKTARHIFLSLVALGEGTQDSRRHVGHDELIIGDETETEVILKTLADARLVTTSETQVEIAHEALIQAWPRLGQWLEENREDLRLHRRLAQDAKEWDGRLDRDVGGLYRGARLAQITAWLEGSEQPLTALETEFVQRSQAEETAVAAKQEAQRQRELADAQAIAEAEAQRAAEADARRQAEAQRAKEAEARQQAESQRAQAAEAERQAEERRFRAARQATVVIFIFLVLAIGAAWYGFDGQRAAEADATRSAESLAIATVAQGEAQLEATRAAQNLAAAEAAEAEALAAEGAVAVEATRAAENLAAAETAEAEANQQRQRALIQSVAALTVVVAEQENDSEQAILIAIEAAWMNKQHETAVAWLIDDGLRTLLNAPVYKAILEGQNSFVRSVTFSPNGQRLASGSSDRTIRLWDVNNPTASPTILEGHEDSVLSVAFSPDGQRLASGSDDHTIRLWDVTEPSTPPIILEGHDSFVWSVAFSPDGQRLASGSDDRTIRLWDVTEPNVPPTLLEGHEDWVRSVAFSPDGQRLASGSEDHTIRLWLMLEALVEIGCSQVRRNLSWQEWQQYLLGEPYRQTCPNWPVHPSVPEAERPSTVDDGN